MVTASHNPSEYNGLKFFGSDGIIVGPRTGRNLARLAEEMSDTKPRRGTVTPAGNLIAVLEGRGPEHIVNPEVLRA